jgi:hypothetical protein
VGPVPDLDGKCTLCSVLLGGRGGGGGGGEGEGYIAWYTSSFFYRGVVSIYIAQ